MTRRKTDLTTLPKTLADLMKGDQTGYELVPAYILHLKTTLMGFFPAITTEDKAEILVFTDLDVLEKAWRMLEPRSSDVIVRPAYASKELGVVYLTSPEESGNLVSPPCHIVSATDLAIIDEQKLPIEWDPNLVSRTLFFSEFERLIVSRMSALRAAASVAA